MKLNSRTTLEQTVAAIAGGAVIGLVTAIVADPLLSSVIALLAAIGLYMVALWWGSFQRVLRVLGWLILENSLLLVGLALLVGVTYGAVVLLNNLWAAALVLGLALAIILLCSNYPQLPPQRRIALQAWTERYWRAIDGGGHAIDANGGDIDRWEGFKWVNIGFGKMALKTLKGHYVRVDVNTGLLVAPTRRWRPEALFELIKVEGNKVALRAHNGLLVSAEPVNETRECRLVADRRDPPGEWEKFRLVDLLDES